MHKVLLLVLNLSNNLYDGFCLPPTSLKSIALLSMSIKTKPPLFLLPLMKQTSFRYLTLSNFLNPSIFPVGICFSPRTPLQSCLFCFATRLFLNSQSDCLNTLPPLAITQASIKCCLDRFRFSRLVLVTKPKVSIASG